MNPNITNPNRLLSLDVFRGLTIVLMIIVNSPGTLYPYSLLAHAEWHGCTLADSVFPSFLFIVGLTSVIHLHQQIKTKDKSVLYWLIFKRSIILFALGLFLNIFPHPIDFSTLRVYGVLQRIAVCYLISSVIYLNTSQRVQVFIYVAILVLYWLLLTQVPVPGHGLNQLTPDGNWASYIDQLIFSPAHLYGKTFDPEGMLSTIPAIATTLGGILVGNFLLNETSKRKKIYIMSLMGIVLISLSFFWNSSYPINKSIWTSSFVILTNGISLLEFAICYYLIDFLGFERWALPFKIFGMNALFAFIFHVVLLKLQFIFYLTLQNGHKSHLKDWLTEQLFGGLSSANASLLFSLCFLMLNFMVVLFLYRRKIVLRI